MKKLILMCLALMSIVLMTSCNSCKGQDEKTEDVTLITSNNFETNVLKIDSIMRHQYPDFVFFEAYGRFVDEEGNVDPQKMGAAYGCVTGIGSIVASVQNDTLVLTKYNENWMEDIFMTPFCAMDAKFAVKLLKDNMDILVKDQPVVLRHQLYPMEPEPRFFIGAKATCHTVNVYTGTIDMLLGNGDFKGKLVGKRDAKVAAE